MRRLGRTPHQQAAYMLDRHSKVTARKLAETYEFDARPGPKKAFWTAVVRALGSSVAEVRVRAAAEGPPHRPGEIRRQLIARLEERHGPGIPGPALDALRRLSAASLREVVDWLAPEEAS